MTHVIREMDEDQVLTDNLSFTFGRGRLISESPHTPAQGAYNIGSPAFCSSRMPGNVASSSNQRVTPSGLPDTTDPALNSLITHIAQQVGQTIRDQLRSECEGRGVSGTQAQSSGQLPSDPTYLNLTGAKLVLQSDVREPPVLRGEGSNKNTVCEWEELMGVYLRKRATPLGEQYAEIMSKLMGKAKDIVRITLRSSPSLKPQENPKVIYDILRQHFSAVTYSCMPMADFYSTVPLAREGPVEYWLRLNKAVDAAEEGLKRLGRHMEDSCREVAMMFVKYCPDPTLAAIFKFKAPDKWTASEVQEHIDRHQTEMKEQMFSKSRYPKPVTVHAQEPALDNSGTTCQSGESAVQGESSATSRVPCNDNCLKTLVSLFDQALSQNNQTARKPIPSDQFQRGGCRVCRSLEHSTHAHCRQKRLCLACFEPNHIKKDCPNRQPGRVQHASSPQNAQPLN